MSQHIALWSGAELQTASTTHAALVVAQRGEVGYFQYGGSATVTLFNDIRWDDDLLHNSRRLWETKCKVGQSIGRTVTTGKEDDGERAGPRQGVRNPMPMGL